MLGSLRIRIGLAMLAALSSGDWARADVPQFEQDVRPIFAQHCLKCHGLEARKAALDLRTPLLIEQGGESGPILTKGSPDESSLFKRVKDRSMPPEGELPLTDEKIDVIRRWIEAGAPAADAGATVVEGAAAEVSQEDRDHWAFRNLSMPATPAVRQADRVRTPIDSFLLEKLEQQGLGFSPDADRPTLARRAYFDLIGLPPSPEEMAAFLADTSPDAYERLIDRLLSSPHFGERWGRHWLDASGYVDTHSADNDAAIILPAEGKWKHRDYVVRAFNSDKPYDRFLTEQLAGDELVEWRTAATYTPEMLELLIATGYLRNVADRTAEDELNTADIRYSVLYDTMELIGTNLLGLTLQCCRCHSHKYEAIPHADYYRMMALFTPAYNVESWLQPHFRGSFPKEKYRELPEISAAEQQVIDKQNADLDARASGFKQEAAAIRAQRERPLFEGKLASVPEPVRADLAAALGAAAETRTEVQKYLVEKLGPQVAVSAEEIAAALSDAELQTITDLERQSAELVASRKVYAKIQVLYDVGPPPPTHILRRGDFQTPGALVSPGFLSVLSQSSNPLNVQAPPEGAPSSGRRLALARWLTTPETPASALAARVMVNRIWSHLFGQGIVKTPGNFGRSGSSPTHPELLDWLASEFISGGWRIKSTIRLLMLSSGYRQGSRPDGESSSAALAVDPGNDLLWKMRLRRLESEIVRDAVLAASGDLDRTFGGPPIPLDPRADGSVVIELDALPTPTSKWRRSLYVMARRAYHLSMLDVFDQPVLATNCTQRSQSAVVTQSLAMLNDPFMFEQADHFARRVAAASPPEARAAAAFRIALCREPIEQETAWSVELLSRQRERHQAAGLPPDKAEQAALANLCHMLLNTNEFLYVH